MNLIIRLIIQIFEAIFEQDVQRRAPQPGPGQARDRAKAKQSAPPKKPGPRSLEEWLASLLGAESPTAARPKRLPAQKRVPPLPTHQARRTEPHQSRFAAEQKSRKRKRGHPYGKDQSGRRQQSKPGFRLNRLPGDNLLEQMIYADVILGPCKARRHTRRAL